MTTDELIKALREKQSRDNRALLDEAADQLELAQKTIIALTEERMKHDEESCECCACKLLDERDSARAEILEQAYLITSLSSIKTTVINDAKAEAVKEFAKRLKKGAVLDDDLLWVTDVDIDNLVKEFTEGKTDE